MRTLLHHLVTLTCAGFVVLGGSTLRAAAPVFEQTNLFEVGQEGYLSYRIPCLVVTRGGALLAFTSARRAASDWADIDLMLRRSTDGGKTWEPRRIVTPAKKDGKATMDNPVAIVDRQSGAIHFLFQTDYARLYYQRSDDEGKTFSAPVEITSAVEGVRAKYRWTVMAPGPGHALQLQNGRLVVPVWYSNGGGHAHRPSVVGVIYSDDYGKTWQAGELVPPMLLNASESAAVQLADGRVALFMRNEEPAYRHAVSFSADGATRWTTPVLHPELYTPISFATVVRLTGPDAADGKTRLLYVHPDSRAKREVISAWGGRTRENETVRLSYDEGVTWPIAKSIEPERSGYADIAVGPDGMIYCLYERGFNPDKALNTRYLTLARFNLEWLTDGKDTLSR
jgi:sialidase-1